MKLTLAEPRLFRDSINIIADLVNEVTFRIDKEKIEVIAMDPANVVMVVFKLLSSAFVEYSVDNNVEMSVSLASLSQVLKRAKPSDTLIMELKDNRLVINLKGESNRTFNLALINLDEGEQKVPSLKFSASVETPTHIFNEIIEDMGIVSESVALIANKTSFVIEGEGGLNHARAEVSTDEETNIKVEEEFTLTSFAVIFLVTLKVPAKTTKSLLIIKSS